MTVGDTLPEDAAYFHARYRRQNPTTPKQDFAGGNVAQLGALPAGLRPELVRTHRRFEPAASPSAADEGTWENFETPQDVCATAYWYQTLPSPRWPALEAYAERVKDLGLPPEP